MWDELFDKYIESLQFDFYGDVLSTTSQDNGVIVIWTMGSGRLVVTATQTNVSDWLILPLAANTNPFLFIKMYKLVRTFKNIAHKFRSYCIML